MPAVVTIPVIQGRDGRLYPVGHRHPPADVERATGLIHAMRCGRGMKFREITAKLGHYGLRISLGTVYTYWAATECGHCTPQPPAPPDPRLKARAYLWR